VKSNHYTEDTLVQQTTADYLQQELGWESVFAYNNEDFGPHSLLGRASDREVVLTRALRSKLQQLNPGLRIAAYDEAIRQITATVASQSLTATNCEKYDFVRNRVQVGFRNDKGERVRDRLRLGCLRGWRLHFTSGPGSSVRVASKYRVEVFSEIQPTSVKRGRAEYSARGLLGWWRGDRARHRFRDPGEACLERSPRGAGGLWWEVAGPSQRES